MSNELQLLQAVRFAAEKHKNQRRKNIEASPYINHPIQVAELIASVGKVTDPVILMGAILHDTVEDTETTIEELDDAATFSFSAKSPLDKELLCPSEEVG